MVLISAVVLFALPFAIAPLRAHEARALTADWFAMCAWHGGFQLLQLVPIALVHLLAGRRDVLRVRVIADIATLVILAIAAGYVWDGFQSGEHAMWMTAGMGNLLPAELGFAAVCIIVARLLQWLQPRL